MCVLCTCFPLWGPFENARWALSWCPSGNALNGRQGTVGPCQCSFFPAFLFPRHLLRPQLESRIVFPHCRPRLPGPQFPCHVQVSNHPGLSPGVASCPDPLTVTQRLGLRVRVHLQDAQVILGNIETNTPQDAIEY